MDLSEQSYHDSDRSVPAFPGVSGDLTPHHESRLQLHHGVNGTDGVCYPYPDNFYYCMPNGSRVLLGTMVERLLSEQNAQLNSNGTARAEEEREVAAEDSQVPHRHALSRDSISSEEVPMTGCRSQDSLGAALSDESNGRLGGESGQRTHVSTASNHTHTTQLFQDLLPHLRRHTLMQGTGTDRPLPPDFCCPGAARVLQPQQWLGSWTGYV